MNTTKNVFGCFVSYTQPFSDFIKPICDSNQEFKAQENLFNSYIWSEKGIDKCLKKLNKVDYGKDLELALFQFYVNPGEYKSRYIKEIEPYRKKEKSIGIPIIVTDENFFNKQEKERCYFLKESVLQKMDLLTDVVKKKKLDTNMDLLKADLLKVLAEWNE